MKSVYTKPFFISLLTLCSLLDSNNLLKANRCPVDPSEFLGVTLDYHSSALTTPSPVPQIFVDGSVKGQTISLRNLCTNKRTEIQNPSGTAAIAITPDAGTVAALCSNQDIIKVWQKKGNKFLKPLSIQTGFSGFSPAMAITTDGNTIAVGYPWIYSQPIRVWQKINNQWVAITSIPVESSVSAIAISPNAQNIVIGEMGGMLDKAGERHSQPIRILVRQPDGQYTVSQRLPDSEDVISIAIRPDLSIIVAGGSNITLRAWKRQANGEYSPSCLIENNLCDVKALAIHPTENIVFIDHPQQPRPTIVGLPIS